MTDSFAEFNNFDKNFDKVNNTFDAYVVQAKQYIYYRNLETDYTESELQTLLYTIFEFTWAPTTEGNLFIGEGCIFNILYNTMEQYFNPNVVFTKEMMQPVLNSLLPYEIHVADIRDGVTYNYDFIISQ